MHVFRFLRVSKESHHHSDPPIPYDGLPLLLLCHPCHLKGPVLEFLKPWTPLKVCPRTTFNQGIVKKYCSNVLFIHNFCFFCCNVRKVKCSKTHNTIIPKCRRYFAFLSRPLGGFTLWDISSVPEVYLKCTSDKLVYEVVVFHFTDRT